MGVERSSDSYLTNEDVLPDYRAARIAAIEDLDELVGLGIIEYTLSERGGQDPLLELRPGPEFERGLPSKASARAAAMFENVCRNCSIGR